MGDHETTPLQPSEVGQGVADQQATTQIPEVLPTTTDLPESPTPSGESSPPSGVDSDSELTPPAADSEKRNYAEMPPRLRTTWAIEDGLKLIQDSVSNGSLPEELQEAANVALTYNGQESLEKSTHALQALGEVLAKLDTQESIKLGAHTREFQRFTTDMDPQTYSLEEWMSKRDSLPLDEQADFDALTRIVYEFPKEEDAHPEDKLIQEQIDILTAKKDKGETLTPQEEQRITLLNFAASATGEGAVLLKSQILTAGGADTGQNEAIAQQVEAASSRLEAFLSGTGVTEADLTLMRTLSTSSIPQLLARSTELHIDGLDNFFFGRKLTLEEVQALVQSISPDDKKDTLGKLPMALPIGFLLLYGLLSAGISIGKTTLKEVK